MITPEPPAGSEHYREGWRHGYEQAAIDRERSADAVRLVPEVVACPARDSAGAPCRRTDPHGPDSHQAHPTIAERARAMGIKPSADASAQIAALTGQPLSSPDTGQADEVLKLRWEVQQLQGMVQDQRRAIAAVRSLCADAMKLPTLEDPRPADDRVSPRAVLAALDRAGTSPDTGQARELTPLERARQILAEPEVAAIVRAELAERSADAGQASDTDGPSDALVLTAAAGRLRAMSEHHRQEFSHILSGIARWMEMVLYVEDNAVEQARALRSARALLGSDTTPDRLAWISEAGETAAAERQARYQETACARRPAATSGDTDPLRASGRRFCEGDCSCGHDHERHGPEVPGCIECSCRITPEARQ